MFIKNPTKVNFRRLCVSHIDRKVSFPVHKFEGFLRHYASAPNITQPSFWLNIIPKPLRPGYKQYHQNVESKEWNPWTFYIIMLLLIGSNSIQMISLEKSYTAFTRRSDARIGLLEEVIKRIKNGEKVDVEKILGTGDKEREQEWQDVLKNIENDDPIWIESSQQFPNSRENTQHKRNSTNRSSDSSNSQAKIEKTRVPPGFF
ncbi:hypothetical protein OnM2_058061 [Erysiphe neolycopersici]|uniref:Uncharacterized protein n=1 Tax=Erysiphe neolycopersici TaxID=212602 RepID=A0A420HQH1_9PEZI|nr:hypothetical protein OnM2_058061 [Erysiphe neolycopersici]